MNSIEDKLKQPDIAQTSPEVTSTSASLFNAG